jgi:hypothetical protein
MYIKNYRSAIVSLFILAYSILLNGATVYAADNSRQAAQTEAPKAINSQDIGGSFTFAGDIAGRLNPKGFGLSGRIKYKNVYQYSEEYDTASAYLQTGAGINVSPAYGQAEAHVEWMPWIFLSLRGQYDYYRYFGAYGSLLSFNSPGAPFGDDLVDDRDDEETGSGQRFMFQPTIQGQVGKIIFRNQTSLAYYTFSGRGPYFLEQEYYTLMKDGDSLLDNQTQVLYQAWKGQGKDQMLLAGPYYEVTRARSARITQKKIGGLLYWVPKESMWGLNRPRVAMQAGYHLQDPNRKGQMFIAIDLGFDIDL